MKAAWHRDRWITDQVEGRPRLTPIGPFHLLHVGQVGRRFMAGNRHRGIQTGHGVIKRGDQFFARAQGVDIIGGADESPW